MPRIFCLSNDLLYLLRKHIVELHGEGIILQKAQSAYDRGRSINLYKLKEYRADMEALIVDIFEDKSLSLKLYVAACN